MGSTGARKGISVQVYRHSDRLVIRLEYDRAEQRQSVYLNGELRSSFYCPVGFFAKHVFRGQDAMSEARGCFAEWAVAFAVEQETYRIRYELARRNTAGDDTRWYWWDRNVDPNEWRHFPEYKEGGHIEVQCTSCGTALRCPQCNSREFAECEECGAELVCTACNPEDQCSECGDRLCCPNCDSEELAPKLVHDVARMQEELQAIDASRLQETLVDVVGDQADSSTSWADVIERVLSDTGCDISRVRLTPRGTDDDEPGAADDDEPAFT